MRPRVGHRAAPRTGWRARSAALLSLLLAGACGAGGPVRYHFRAPLVGSVRAAPVRVAEPDGARADRTAAHDPARGRGRPGHAFVAGAGAPGPAGAPTDVPRAGVRPVRLAVPAEPLRGRRATGDELAALLRALVGDRDERGSDASFAVAALRAIGLRPDPALAGADDAAALIALARERGALAATGSSAHLGDLLVFEGLAATPGVALVGVALTTDDRAVIEFVYLARGVVRRGFLSREHRDDRRDAAGRVLNTILNHSDGGIPRDAPSLAGQLHTGVIRLADLLR